jgi:aminoglycoside/choline kinase family phosphotransferase
VEQKSPQIQLSNLFKKFSGSAPEEIIKLPSSGSYRQYYRLKKSNDCIIGVYNEDYLENKAFIEFTKHFLGKNLPVPKLLTGDIENNVYLLQDLGDTSLLSFLFENDFPDKVSAKVLDVYKKVLTILPYFQIEGGEGLNFELCYPRHAFDRQSMMWDLNYFKYYFLKLAKVPFNEQSLENDFNTLIDFLLQADCHYFMYRDFQSRNIMLFNGDPYFIDYQGGRQGALHYDIASILFEAKTRLPAGVREELLDFYLAELNKHVNLSRSAFFMHYYGYAYIRLMQAMGAYGFRGLYERKELFLESISPALNNLEWLLDNVDLQIKLPELTKVWNYLCDSEYIRQLGKKHLLLKININSFSYRRGIPTDDHANGGGFVFDCRSIHNPGRYEEYKQLTGKDAEVQKFLDNEPEMEQFIEHVFALVNQSINKYISKGFTNLMINFGCTGGQHRSVYSAERLYKYLMNGKRSNELEITLRHRDL